MPDAVEVIELAVAQPVVLAYEPPDPLAGAEIVSVSDAAPPPGGGDGVSDEDLAEALEPYATTVYVDTEVAQATAAFGAAQGSTHTVNAPTALVQIQHGLAFRPGGVTCIDSHGFHVLWHTRTDPLPGVTEIGFGFGFTGTIELS